MGSPNRITKAQLVEQIRATIDFEERRKFLRNKISQIDEELSSNTKKPTKLN